jgi:anti-sigma factor (TIGR02949 family)
MIDCKQAVQHLWGYLDRNLEQAREDELEQHLGLCRHCCGELEFAKQIRDRLAAGVAADKVEAPVRERLQQFIRGLEVRDEPH